MGLHCQKLSESGIPFHSVRFAGPLFYWHMPSVLGVAGKGSLSSLGGGGWRGTKKIL